MGFLASFGWSANVLWVLASTVLLGMAAGVVGSFAFWKRHSLLGDALAHAALPGVVLGFLAAGGKHMPLMLLGAGVSALTGALFTQWIRSSTRIKEDAAMGIMLSVYFGFGIMLLTIASRSAGGGQSGLDSFIFGQAAAMMRQDVTVMAALAAAVLLVVLAAFKEWKLFLFDPAFGRGLGLPLGWMNGLYLALLVLVIVIGIQAVGVILIAALLIMPGVSARYWTHSFGTSLVLAALIGGGAGAAGTLVSTLGKGWPTGPFIVLAAGAAFAVSMLAGTKGGIVAQAVRERAARPRASAGFRFRGLPAGLAGSGIAAGTAGFGASGSVADAGGPDRSGHPGGADDIGRPRPPSDADVFGPSGRAAGAAGFGTPGQPAAASGKAAAGDEKAGLQAPERGNAG